ncbi:hypothetical protein [Streptomyces sp. NPDC002952]|uniref:hypothetical protein n=1 Tax=Streptomyces sp. NPDC002952 TaxID=3364673 RepID=UPI0036818F8A
MVMMAMALTACGSEQRDAGRQPKAKSRTSATTDEAARDAVAVDIRAVVDAGGFETPRFIAAKNLLGPCEVGAVVRARTELNAKSIAEVVSGLKGRGWRQNRHLTTDVNELWGLERKGWQMNVVAGSVFERAVSFQPGLERQPSFKGVVFRGTYRGESTCSVPSAATSSS